MISLKLKKTRQQQQLTQKQAADKLKVTEKTLREWERGKTGSLARAFRVLQFIGLAKNDD